MGRLATIAKVGAQLCDLGVVQLPVGLVLSVEKTKPIAQVLANSLRADAELESDVSRSRKAPGAWRNPGARASCSEQTEHDAAVDFWASLYLSGLECEGTGGDHDEFESVLRNQFNSPLIVDAALKTSVHTGHRHDVRFVEDGDPFVMLSLGILHDQREFMPVTVYR